MLPQRNFKTWRREFSNHDRMMRKKRMRSKGCQPNLMRDATLLSLVVFTLFQLPNLTGGTFQSPREKVLYRKQLFPISEGSVHHDTVCINRKNKGTCQCHLRKAGSHPGIYSKVNGNCIQDSLSVSPTKQQGGTE